MDQAAQEKTLPKSGTVYTVPHPKAFTSRSYVLLHESYNDATKAGPSFLDLLGDERTGPGFLNDIFNTISQARGAGGQKRQDFFAVINSVTPEADVNRVSQQAYFHAHVVAGEHDDPFVQAVSRSQSYGQGEPDPAMTDAVRAHKRFIEVATDGQLGRRFTNFSLEEEQEEFERLRLRAGQSAQQACEDSCNDANRMSEAVEDFRRSSRLAYFGDSIGAEGPVEMFEPFAPFRLAPQHQMIIVHREDLETLINDPEAMATVRDMLLEYMPRPSGRTGARIVIDTFTYNDRPSKEGDYWNNDSGIVLHIIGDLEEELVTDARGKTAQRRWFEPPKPG